ncbi:hypothetical protein OAS39_10370 [Pirellulales bacterium]|nr:hypothetical protein [Pirellulales bacterium]
MSRPLTIVCIALLLASQAAAADQMPLLFSDDFEHDFARWETSDIDQPFWELTRGDPALGNATQCFRVTGTSTYKPPHRSPHSLALVKELSVGDFELTVDAQSTDIESGNHRDLCVIWGYQDPAHYYYVHLGALSDPHSCQIFIVDGAPRKAITIQEAPRTPWEERWHRVKVVRLADSGTMNVYFDDMQRPLMTARDKTFETGQVGVGTFDNHGNWDNFMLYGRTAEPK